MKIELSEAEAETLLKFVDIGLKAEGIRAMAAANMIINKINHAQKPVITDPESEPSSKAD